MLECSAENIDEAAFRNGVKKGAKEACRVASAMKTIGLNYKKNDTVIQETEINQETYESIRRYSM